VELRATVHNKTTILLFRYFNDGMEIENSSVHPVQMEGHDKTGF
jgi:hypothetical protein